MPLLQRKLKKAITKNYSNRGINTKNFDFDIRNDTIIQGKSIDQATALKKMNANKRNAARSLNNTSSARATGSYANPKDQRTTRNTGTGKYKVSSVYNKEELKNTMTPLNQQKLTPGARKRKAERDLLFAKTPGRKAKKAHAQRERRANPSAAEGKDFDHKDQTWETPSKNRSNDGEGTKKESGKTYNTN
tara:strand:+ start:711 stop:1280 length:570 start_codon:yes stop_codon:yes gene_type:complete